MSELVGRARFAPPPPPRVHVERAHLVDTLDLSSEVPLTIVSGPPGCGKTVALSSWLARRPDLRAVWMSCDERDVDPVVFWTSLTQGLQMASPDAWLDVRDLLQGDQPSLQEVALSAVKELEALDEPVTIVIDDFHVARAASASVSLVVEALPSTARLVIGTRTDPQLPLHRMRLHSELLEIRAEELRFSLDETAALVAALGVELDNDSSQALYERSEGWVAAVHLAAMSLRGRDDPQAFLRSFSGENRLIAEFLVHEVLERHSELARRFLRESSVLDEMDAVACTAVTGIPDSDKLLRDLSAENMLVVPLGDGMSYRYHRLFRDLLRYQLRAGSAERWLELHQAAARLFELRGELDQAARHLTLAGDDDAAFALLHEHAVEVHVRGGTLAMQRFVTALDLRRAEVDASRAVDIAAALAYAGAGTDASLWISRAGAMRSELSDVDRARLAVACGMVAIDACEPEECNAALAELPTQPAPNDPVIDGVPGMSLRSKLWVGDFAGSHAAFDAAVSNGRTPLQFREVMMTSGLSWTMCVEGHLREAYQLAETTLARAEQFAVEIHPMLSDALRTRGRVLYERGRIDDAESILERSIAMGERVRPPAVLLSAIALARLLTVEGRFAEASATVDHARSCLRPGSRSALAALVDTCDARLALAAGEHGRAETLIEALEPSDLRSRLEAAVHFANGKPDCALELLDRTHPATHRQVVDTQVLRTRIVHALGDDGADDALALTVELAREEQFVLALVDGMPELVDRVSYCLRSRPLHDFERHVLERLDRPKASTAHSGPVDLVEQLTSREETVLRYLDSRLTVHEIAAELFVSPNTLRTHVKAVYRKLGVSSRREAISEGRRLQLLAAANR